MIKGYISPTTAQHVIIDSYSAPIYYHKLRLGLGKNFENNRYA